MRKAFPSQVDISLFTFFKVIIFVATLWFAYVIRDVLAILFFAVVIASALHPFVNWFYHHHVPRVLGILLIYAILFGTVALTFVLMIPPLIQQAEELYSVFPAYFSRAVAGFEALRNSPSLSPFLGDISNTLGNFTQFLGTKANFFSLITAIVGSMVSFVIMLVMTFYLLLEEDAIRKTFRFVAPMQYQGHISQLFARIQVKIGLWLRGQIILSGIIGLSVFIGLSFLHVPYALVLAIFAAIAEFVPYVGPTLAAIPAVFLAFAISPLLAIFVLIFYIFMQQMENHLLVPKVMQRTIGLNPIISIVSLMVGAKLGGFAGVALAIPVATAVSVIVMDFFDRNESRNVET
jgi:predicted PurR-regulated permease PerM